MASRGRLRLERGSSRTSALFEWRKQSERREMKSDPVEAVIEAMERKPDVVESLADCIAMLNGVKSFLGDLGPKGDAALARAKEALSKARVSDQEIGRAH